MTSDYDLEPYSIFSARQKIVIVGLTVMSIAMVIALPVNIYYPALNAIKEVTCHEESAAHQARYMMYILKSKQH